MTKICKTEGCEGVVYCKSLCNKHYRKTMVKTCKIEGCKSKAHLSGMCVKHKQELDSAICKIDGCENKVRRSGMCNTHLGQLARFGRILERGRHSPNEIRIEGAIAYISLYNRNLEKISETKISATHVDRIKNIKWHVNGTGYIIGNNGKLLHRVIINCPDGLLVDHIDHDILNNTDENLRTCNAEENTRNFKPYGKSGVGGVHWHTRDLKWCASITISGERKSLGYFDDFDDAVKARKNAEVRHHGEFAYDPKQDATLKKNNNLT